MIGDGSDERKLFDMLKSAPPKNLVTMLTSPNALYYFLYQRGEEKWGDSNKFEWNPLRVQRNVDFARITLAPLTDDLLTPTSPLRRVRRRLRHTRSKRSLVAKGAMSDWIIPLNYLHSQIMGIPLLIRSLMIGYYSI